MQFIKRKHSGPMTHYLSRRKNHSTVTLPERVPIAEICISPQLDDPGPILEPYFLRKQPVVLRGAVSNQSAIQLWKSWDHLEQIVDGNTTVAVEIGGNYASTEKNEIRFGDYISYLRFFEERYGRSSEILPSATDLVYLAQNEVVDGLRENFTVPSFTGTLGHGHPYSVMMWIGPYGCVSPLHFDPLDNILMQFVGVKRALLYPPNTQVYAGYGENQQNTSPLNPEQPLDLDTFPLLAELPPVIHCMLYPGDVLYIPQKWWHYVRTVETSISINAWWR
jgi:[histone H3]-dimethyl/trimethyl-L-lysine36 demethylase